MSTLLPFHIQLGNAWRLFLHRWGSAVVIHAFMMVPSLLMYPLVTEYLAAVQAGTDPVAVLQSSMYGSMFVVGFVLLILLGVLTTSALMIVFAAQEKISLFTAVASAVRRYIPVLYTSVLSALAVIGALVPAYALNYLYYAYARTGLTLDASGIAALDIVVLIAIVALLIPAAIIAVWVMYAPLAVALKATSAGFTALLHSKHVVHHHVWQVLWRMLGAVLLFQIIGVSVRSLPFASFFVPFILTLVVTAFFVELYKELHEGQVGSIW